MKRLTLKQQEAIVQWLEKHSLLTPTGIELFKAAFPHKAFVAITDKDVYGQHPYTKEEWNSLTRSPLEFAGPCKRPIPKPSSDPSYYLPISKQA